MAFAPANVTYPRPNLQHIFDRHKVDWGFLATDNWNTANGVILETTLRNFLNNPANNVYAGTYRAVNAYLSIDPATRLCAIVYRGGSNDYQIWSGWTLSIAQFDHATNPPNSLGGGALLLYATVLERIIDSRGFCSRDLDEYFQKYKSDKNRYNTDVESALERFFSVLDNYLPEGSALRSSASPAHILDYGVVKKHANELLALLERSF